ncbi:MAG: hypothetical protein J6V21_06815, partial [Alistipes sp.]|nr:hypothetical protein [Alistipes sp.]
MGYQDSVSGWRLSRLVCAMCSECAVLLRNIAMLIENHLLKQVWYLLFNQHYKPSVSMHIPY